MSHQISIDTRTGQYQVFTAGALPWHRLGKNVSEAQTAASAMALAGLDVPVYKAQLFAHLDPGGPRPVDAWGTFRSSDGAFLGAVGEGYEVIQAAEGFDFVDSLLEVENGARYDSAGQLFGGSRYWLLARIPRLDGEVVPGDLHQSYLLFTSSHDGSLACQSLVTDVRVVCNNTLTAALRGKDARVYIKHTKSAHERLERARRLMAGAVASIEDVRAKLRELAHRQMTRESFEAALDKLFPKKADSESGASDTRRKNILSDIVRLYELNDGRRGVKELAGTAGCLLNSIVEYTDFERSVRMTDRRSDMSEQGARAETAIWGSGAELKSKALEVILEATSGNPRKSYSEVIVPKVSPSMPAPTFGGLLDSVLDVSKIEL